MIQNAKILLKWDSGVETEIGTLEMESKGKIGIETRVKVSRQRIGWSIVRIGMKLIFPKRKWRTEERMGGKDAED